MRYDIEQVNPSIIDVNTPTEKANGESVSHRLAPYVLTLSMLYTVMGGEGIKSGISVLCALIFVATTGRKSFGRMQHSSITFLIIIIFLLVLFVQHVFHLNTASFKTGMGYLLKICIGLITALLIGDKLDDSFLAVKTIALFTIMFGLVNLVLEVRGGFSVARSSALDISSKNFTSAVLYLGSPLLLCVLCEKHCDDKLRQLCACGLIFALIITLLSASKTAYACATVIVFSLLFRKTNNFLGKMLYLTISILCIAFIFGIINSDSQIGSLVSRGFSTIMSDGNDSSRSLLRDISLSIFDSYDTFSKLFGKSEFHFYFRNLSFPPHNLAYELLLCFGYVGLITFAIGNSSIIIDSIRNSNPNDIIYIYILLLITAMTAWYQPFFSTSYVCGMIFIMSLISISYFGNAK